MFTRGKTPGLPQLEGISLRLQTLVFVGGLMALALVLFLVVTSRVITESFRDLQENVVAREISAEVFQVDTSARVKARLVKDNAEWDDAFHFLAGENPNFLEENYAAGVDSAGQDFVFVFDAGRNLVGSISTDGSDRLNAALDGGEVAKMQSPIFLGETGAVGLLRAGEDVLLAASAPVLRSDLTGPSNGWLVFATFLSQNFLNEIAELTGGNSTLEALPQSTALAAVPADFVVQTRALGEVGAVQAPDSEVPEGFYRYRLVFASLGEATPVVIKAEIPARILNRAIGIRDEMIYFSLWGGAAMVLIALLVFEFVVLRRIVRLEREIGRIAMDPGEVRPIVVPGSDEIASLARSTNRMISAIQAGQSETSAQRELLQNVLDAANEGILAVESVRSKSGAIVDFRIVLANKALGRIVKRDAKDLVGKCLLVEFPGNADPEIFIKYTSAIQLGEPVTLEKYYEENGILGWFRDSITPWGDGLVILVEDISGRKEREATLRQSLDDVERLNRAMIGREVRILELKRDINQLCRELGREEPFQTDADHAKIS